MGNWSNLTVLFQKNEDIAPTYLGKNNANIETLLQISLKIGRGLAQSLMNNSLALSTAIKFLPMSDFNGPKLTRLASSSMHLVTLDTFLSSTRSSGSNESRMPYLLNSQKDWPLNGHPISSAGSLIEWLWTPTENIPSTLICALTLLKSQKSLLFRRSLFHSTGRVQWYNKTFWLVSACRWT